MMTQLWRRLHLFVSAKLGRCPRCMRWSLHGAVVGWFVLAAAWIAAPALWWVVLPWPASFTALWLLHLIVFGMRGVRRLSVGDGARGQGIAARPLSRRHVLHFARFAAAAVAASVVIPRSVRADDQECPDGMHLCSDNTHCCPNGASYDCVVDNCDAGKSRTCYPYSDENAKYLLQCCGELVTC